MIKVVQELHRDLAEQEKILSNNQSESGALGFSDIMHESQKVQSPLLGLKSFRLMSLENALQGLDDLMPEIERYVWIVKRQCENPADGLLQYESAAIMIYTMEWHPYESCLYRLLNKALRSESRDAIKRWFPYLRLLVHALDKLPSYKGTVYRSLREDLREDYKVGSQIIWWGLSSAASKMSVVNNFVGAHGNRTLFVIECQNGKRIHNHSPFSAEDEILLLPGSQFEVTDNSDAGNGLTMISLKEIDQPYSLY